MFKCFCLNVCCSYLTYMFMYKLKTLYFQGLFFSAITTMDDVDFNTELKQRYNWYGNMYINVYY